MSTDYKKLIDDMIAGKHMISAAIVNKEGTTMATSTNFQVSKEEAKTLIDGFDKTDVIAAKGLTINGKKHQFLSKTANFLKTKNEKGGAVATRTPKSLVLGLYDEKLGVDGATKALEGIAEKLKKAGL